MASNKEYLEFILGQLSELEDITYRTMMGEFIILRQAGHQFDPQITILFDEHFDEFIKVIEDYPDAS